MTTSSAGQSADPASPTCHPVSTESDLRLEATALRDFRAALTADLMERTRRWLSATDKQDLAERWRPDLDGGEVLIDHPLASTSDQAPSLACLGSRGIRPAALRYAGLTARPAVPWCVSWTSLASAQAALDSLLTQFTALSAAAPAGSAPTSSLETLRERFVAALVEDLDTSTALEVVWQAARADLPSGERRDLLLEFDQVLGLDLASGLEVSGDSLPEGAEQLIQERAAARQRRDWAHADALRKELAAMDVEAQDGPDGSVYRHAAGAH